MQGVPSGPESRGRWPGQGLRWRVGFSIVAGVAWLVFVLLYVGFWWPEFSLGQSIILLIVSFVLLVGTLGLVWAMWGLRFVR